MNILITLAFSNAHHMISRHNLLALIFLLTQTAPPSTAQLLPTPPPVQAGKKSVAGVMVVVAVLFFISGFLSLYTRQCAGRRPRTRGRRLDLALPIGGNGNGRRPHMEPHGLNPDVIESFPTFLYATVKGLMVAKEALACAVCLDEFQDDETLRLIPICSHVFHPACIDAWLASNSTCPVCRANLVQRSEEEPPLVAVEVHDEEHQHQPNDDSDSNAVIGGVVESPKENVLGRIRSCTMNSNHRTPRSRSTGLLFGILFRRSDSRGGSVERYCERFTTVRLPEEVRRKLVVSCKLKRARSCVSFGRMGSGRRGYRERSSVGSGAGRSYLECLQQYERFHGEEQWGFALTTTPFYATSQVSQVASVDR